MKNLSKKDIKSKRDLLNIEMESDGLVCISEVCKCCENLVPDGHEVKCIYMNVSFTNSEYLEGHLLPDECSRRLESMVVGEQRKKYKDLKEVMDDNDEWLISTMEFENWYDEQKNRNNQK